MSLYSLKAGDEVAYRDDWGTLSIVKVHKVTKTTISIFINNQIYGYRFSKKTRKRIGNKWSGDTIIDLTDDVRRYIELRELRDKVWSLLKKAEDEVKNMDNFKCTNIIKFLKGELGDVNFR